MSFRVLLVCLLLPLAASGCVEDRNGGGESSREARYSTLQWTDLSPVGWQNSDPLQGEDIERLDDEDPRAQKLYRKLREFLDSAPLVSDYHGQPVRLPGFVVPLEYSDDSQRIREFLLVPYSGACIHTPPPARNQIVLVSANDDALPADFDLSRPVWVRGTLSVLPRETQLAVSGYELRSRGIDLYQQEL